MSQFPHPTFDEIGARLRAHRIGRALTPEDLAARLGISRAALYRAEKGNITKISLLNAIADELGISLPTLLGVGVEYVDNALSFFERMRQIEDGCDQIIGLFSPVSYLLTSSEYDRVLADVLTESVVSGSDASPMAGMIAQLLDILAERKRAYHNRRPLIASIVSSLDLARLLRNGLEGRTDLPADLINSRRRMALAEVRHIACMLREQPIGVQIGVAREPIPATSFQVVRKDSAATLTVSPFRLGQQPNIQIGVGMVTSAPEAVSLHESIARRLWDTSLKSTAAAEHVEALIEQFGIDSESN